MDFTETGSPTSPTKGAPVLDRERAFVAAGRRLHLRLPPRRRLRKPSPGSATSRIGTPRVEVLDAALSSYPGLAELAGKIGFNRALLAPPDAPTVTLSEAEAADYTGRYQDPGLVVTFVPSNGGLELKAEQLDQKNSWRGAIGPSPQSPT